MNLSLLLTLNVGDKRDNLEFVRRGGSGGVPFPHEDSEIKLDELGNIGKPFGGCLIDPPLAKGPPPFKARDCAEKIGISRPKLSFSMAWD